MPMLSELMSGIRGVGSGATAGLVKYPSAAIMMLLDQGGFGNMVRSGRMTWKDALTQLEDQQASDRQDNPKATFAGNLLGGIGLTAYTGTPTGLLPLVGTTAAMGGVQGFTEKENLGDAALGATAGALTGGALKGAQSALGTASDYVARSAIASKIDKLIASGKEGQKTLIDIFKNPNMTDKQFKQSLKDEGTTLAKEAGYLRDTVRDRSVSLNNIDALTNPVKDLYFKPTLQSTFRDVVDAGKQGAVGSMGGLGLNEVIGLLSNEGRPVDPITAMLGGGAFAAKTELARVGSKMATRQAIKNASKTEAARLPGRAAMAVTPVLSSSINQLKQPEKVYEESSESAPWERIEVPEPKTKEAEYERAPWEK